MTKAFIVFLLLVWVCIGSCIKKSELTDSPYAISLFIDSTKRIPVNAEILSGQFIVRNGEEEIRLDITQEDDSIVVKHPAYNSEFKFKISRDRSLNGFWYNREKGNYKMRLTGTPFPYHFEEHKEFSINGTWSARFSPNSPQEYPALGVFNDSLEFIRGTFRTETGDYRYLVGSYHESGFTLSTFDFAHAFRFDGEFQKENELTGTFYSGHHWKESWVASKSNTSPLRSSLDITKVIDKLEPFFSFERENGSTIKINDPSLENKAIIVQIFGSWCPNCYDETNFLNEVYSRYSGEDLKIIGLGFEMPESKDEGWQKLKNYKNALNVKYEMLYGGQASKKIASEFFPFLNEITSFPTTLYFDKDHNLVRIHTGFNGPGTGNVYEDFRQETFQLLDSVVANATIRQ